VPEFNQNHFVNMLSSTYDYISGMPSIWLGARKNAISFRWLFLQGARMLNVREVSLEKSGNPQSEQFLSAMAPKRKFASTAAWC
jgi:hypothetical protein